MSFLATAPAPAGPDYGAAVVDARDQGMQLLTDNVLYLFALPVAWVGYRVVRKIIAKIS